ncbi:hypothetical protein [Deinococcus pimensis]|uniref:hypothetical protein n=1 Tax=Deinococcus pimensis TaxID=309888 RepID=UPI0004838612|nr:hypothetical protein [Deinococcus pimensis]
MTTTRTPREHARLLLVTSSVPHEQLLRDVLKEFSDTARLTTVEHTDQVLDVLKSEGWVNLIVLDVPEEQTEERLAWLASVKQDERHRIIPIVVMSSRDDAAFLHRTYSSYATACVLRADDPQEFRAGMVAMLNLFLRIAVLADPEDAARNHSNSLHQSK